MFETLDEVRRDWLGRLARAPRDRKCPMHTPVVVSAPADARVMVLRAFDQATGVLRFHTDTRSPKVAAIADDPRMAVLLYDKSAKIQIRLRGTGRVETDGPIADAAWAAGTNFARRCYLGDGPGSLADGPTSGLPPEFEGAEPDDAQLVPARPNFAVLLIELAEVDWLYLAHTGHMRAQFTRGGESWEGRWVTP
ncbi:pyridoxamine 5'-phosphate oxidase family protein [Erythrobacter sp. T5W1-R]|uniref:pyridoxamine 5'-phosphate oxidase family protein n=1 Tax=Erythrobacter sp. T5W1-R TaxID=3101752 RepID=UPI002AFEEC0B|nr:pyridoxamine 5'-phosphate oxidase family protein [Erythrobacter sp. T5W1-R]MEA1618085.1 pyridoxamine 5'-phosphate oxidase family protein [Erythrobacter sp. T5W1-R]